MGSCASVHKDPDAALKLRLSFRSKNHNLVIPSPVKDARAAESQRSTAPSHSASRDFGSKEESFFDTNPWLDSDCEDDFLSINGDFTPSRGSTPVHHKLSTPTSKPLSEFPSPTDKKKRLSELFSETVAPVKEVVDGGATETPPYISGVNPSERSNDSGSLKSPSGRKQPWKPPQCCLPGLRYSHSFSDRKKMESSVAVASVG